MPKMFPESVEAISTVISAIGGHRDSQMNNIILCQDE